MIDVRPGDVIAERYRVTHELGRGGMGVVVAADHLQLPQQVAIKFLKKDADAVALERFRREAQIVVQLRSEHVCRVLDVGSLPDGAPFIVMDLLQGQDLAEKVAVEGPMELADAVDAVLQACEAVAEAHVRGVVHRDLKPSNLFLARRVDGSGVIKVLDFGISKSKPDDGASSSLTASGAMLGSPRFMSPEQLVSTRRVDHRTDVWSLGVVLRELLTGRAAFEGDTAAELFVAILQEDLGPLSSERPGLPLAVDTIIDRCLRKPADERFQSVGELALALEPFASEAWRPIVDRVVRILTGAGWAVPRPELTTSRPPDGVSISPSAAGASGSPASPHAETALGEGVVAAGITRPSEGSHVEAERYAHDATSSAAGEGLPYATGQGYPTSGQGQVAGAGYQGAHLAQSTAGGTTRSDGGSRGLLIGLVVGIGSTLLVGVTIFLLAFRSAPSKPATPEKEAKAKRVDDDGDEPAPAPAPRRREGDCPYAFCDFDRRVPTGEPIVPSKLLVEAETIAKQQHRGAELVNFSTTALVDKAFEEDTGGSVSFLFRYEKSPGRYAVVLVGMTPNMTFVRHQQDVGMKPTKVPPCKLPDALEAAYAGGFDRMVGTTALYGGMGTSWQLVQEGKPLFVGANCKLETIPGMP